MPGTHHDYFLIGHSWGRFQGPLFAALRGFAVDMVLVQPLREGETHVVDGQEFEKLENVDYDEPKYVLMEGTEGPYVWVEDENVEIEFFWTPELVDIAIVHSPSTYDKALRIRLAENLIGYHCRIRFSNNPRSAAPDEAVFDSFPPVPA